MRDFKILEGQQALAHSVKGRLNAVYGVPGAGKTTFCLSATKNNKVLFIDTENAVGKVFGSIDKNQKNADNFFSVNVETITEAIEFLSDPSTNLLKFDIIAFDSATHLVEEEMKRMRKTRKLTQNDWGIMGNNFKDLLSQLQNKGINVIITAHETETADKDGTMQHRPKTEGKVSIAALIQRADNLLFIDVNEKGERVLHTQPSPTYYAKSRDPLKECYIGSDVNYETIANDFTKIAERFATKLQVNEIFGLMEVAKVKSSSAFYEAICWDGKGKLAIHNYLRGIELLHGQIKVNTIKKDNPKENVESDSNSKSNLPNRTDEVEDGPP